VWAQYAANPVCTRGDVGYKKYHYIDTWAASDGVYNAIGAFMMNCQPLARAGLLSILKIRTNLFQSTNEYSRGIRPECHEQSYRAPLESGALFNLVDINSTCPIRMFLWPDERWIRGVLTRNAKGFTSPENREVRAA